MTRGSDGPRPPSIRRPGGLMRPRSPAFLMLLLVLTLAAIWFWGKR
jgi:hypothetical protein